jgi:hypothetical protein
MKAPFYRAKKKPDRLPIRLFNRCLLWIYGGERNHHFLRLPLRLCSGQAHLATLPGGLPDDSGYLFLNIDSRYTLGCHFNMGVLI